MAVTNRLFSRLWAYEIISLVEGQIIILLGRYYDEPSYRRLHPSIRCYPREQEKSTRIIDRDNILARKEPTLLLSKKRGDHKQFRPS